MRLPGCPWPFFLSTKKTGLKDFEKIKEQVSRLHDYSIRNGTRFGISNIEAIRQGNNNSQGFQSICGAGIASITVNYQGGIYPCHRCYYNDMGDFYKMGSLDTGISYARRAFINEINNLDMLPPKCRKCHPAIRKNCHFCFSTNKNAYNNPHYVPNTYCLLMKELYYLLLEKENRVRDSQVSICQILMK